jgi:hypothetical protein
LVLCIVQRIGLDTAKAKTLLRVSVAMIRMHKKTARHP